MLKIRLEEDLKKLVDELGFQVGDVVCNIPKNSSFGDYTTNLALQLANQQGVFDKQSPIDIAKKISVAIAKKIEELEYIQKVEIAGPGFINIYLKESSLMDSLEKVCDYSYLVNPKLDTNGDRKKILVEFGHPNTHKEFHIGHMRDIIIGESISRILEGVGNKVFRVNYQGDIGLHVAKALWGLEKVKMQNAKVKSLQQKAHFLGQAYAAGSKAYEEDEKAKADVLEINNRIYQRDPKIIKLWEKTRKWSLDYYDQIYKVMGVSFDRLFFESEVEALGKQLVLENLGKVFEEDQGAIIFRGELHGLHNRVFVTSAGHPTYEGKEVGLAKIEYEEFNYDKSIHVVANEQDGYFQVAFRAIELVFPHLIGKKYHLSYGFVDLKEGKMSSRTGQVVTFDWLFSEIKNRVEKIMKSASERGLGNEEREQIIDMVSIGAIKFTILKFAPSTNISFDLEKSVALEGDSGPYIQYTYARAKSVLRNANYDYQPTEIEATLEKEERDLLRSIEHFTSFIEESALSLHPNILCGYLLDIGKLFNLFYQKHSIIKGEKSEFRLALTCAVAVILKQGLYLLGIDSPERM